MGVRVKRKKKRVWLLSLLYGINRLLPLSQRRRLKLYLDLEWIFDRLAMEASFKHYKPEEHPHRRFANSFLLDRLTPAMQVLDLGCAKGDVSNALAGRVDRVVGVDHDAAAIALARKRYQRPNLGFVHGDALQYLRDCGEHFDVLVLSHILEHLDAPEDFLERFAPHFTWFYIELPDFDKSYLNHYRLDLGSSLVYSDDDHVSEFDREELQELVKRAGLEVVDAEYRFGLQRLWCRKS